MAKDKFNELLRKISKMEADDCGRLLSAYLNLPSSEDRKLVIRFAETLIKPSDRYH
ncbi:hypothetical protein [Kordiimonas laminariae]|uniref:hypothetical protein n=1 Tax=Kordiimonas laminariae TaxID=2917717 RepID=UPI001FF30FAD|nr:hypothetical protein [Kordiimonas laminariae]MCK0070868.1 hypothetical protein [Kordiimonas laminariae]